MNENSIDPMFRRFAEEGDVAALAAVFDRLAPDLGPLARRLVREAHRADDLVQEAFLTAIETPAAVDPALPVGPWLVGVLVNRARAERRVDPDRLVERSTDSPSARSEERELVAALRRGLEALTPGERAAVVGQLFQGRQGNELAERLGVSPGALRVRLHRGLADSGRPDERAGRGGRAPPDDDAEADGGALCARPRRRGRRGRRARPLPADSRRDGRRGMAGVERVGEVSFPAAPFTVDVHEASGERRATLAATPSEAGGYAVSSTVRGASGSVGASGEEPWPIFQLGQFPARELELVARGAGYREARSTLALQRAAAGVPLALLVLLRRE